MITHEQRTLINEACSMHHCPEIVRSCFAEFLSTGTCPSILRHDASRGMSDEWFYFYLSIRDSTRFPREYETMISRARRYMGYLIAIQNEHDAAQR